MKHIKLFEAFINEGESVPSNTVFKNIVKKLALGNTSKRTNDIGNFVAFEGKDGNLYLALGSYLDSNSLYLEADDDTEGWTYIKITPEKIATVVKKAILLKNIDDASVNLLKGIYGHSDAEDFEEFKDNLSWDDAEHKFLDFLAWSEYHEEDLKFVLKAAGVNISSLPSARINGNAVDGITGKQYTDRQLKNMCKKAYPDWEPEEEDEY